MCEHAPGQERKAPALSALEMLLASMEIKLREAAGEATLAATLALNLGATLSSTELHALAITLNRLAMEARGQRWTHVEPAAAAPPRPDPTVHRDGISQVVPHD